MNIINEDEKLTNKEILSINPDIQPTEADNNKNEYGDLAYSVTTDINQEITPNKKYLNSENNLNSIWIFWFLSRKEKDHKIPYSDRLKKIAEFCTIEKFFKFYMFIKSPSDMERNTELSLFKEGFKPLWESCLGSGCWFIRYKKNDDPYELDLKWEKLVFALIDDNILGAVLSIRGRETIIELWFNYIKNEPRKNYLGQKMKELISLEDSINLFFKDNEKSLKDKSTLKNAETYNIINDAS